MVPRRDAEPLLVALALPLPPARLPLRPARRGERPPDPRRAGVRAPRHRGLRRRPLLGRRRDVRQAQPHRHLPDEHRPEHDARPDAETLHVLPSLCDATPGGRSPQHPKPVGSGRATLEAGDLLAEHERTGVYQVRRRRGTDGSTPQPLFYNNRDRHRAPLRHGAAVRVPEGRHQRPRRLRCGDGQPGRAGTKAAWALFVSTVPAGETIEIRLRLFSPTDDNSPTTDWAGAAFDETVRGPAGQADAFYAA